MLKLFHRLVALPAVYDFSQWLAGASISRRIMLEEFESLPPDGRALDVGGGTGLSRSLLPEQWSYCCLDPDPHKLMGFRAKFPLDDSVEASGCSIPLPHSSFDLCIMVAVSHHLTNEEFDATLVEIKRVLRPRGNALSSIIHPVDPRPLYIIAVPVILALLQITIMRVSGPLMGKTKFGPINYPLFYACFSAPYLFSCLFWPQSVSIHPYLYDYFLIGLTVVFIFINTARFKVLTRPVAVWCIGFAFLVSFNLQKIAQSSRHVGAYYAPWDAVPASN